MKNAYGIHSTIKQLIEQERWAALSLPSFVWALNATAHTKAFNRIVALI